VEVEGAVDVLDQGVPVALTLPRLKHVGFSLHRRAQRHRLHEGGAPA
jgi:hypothetical protein